MCSIHTTLTDSTYGCSMRVCGCSSPGLWVFSIRVCGGPNVLYLGVQVSESGCRTFLERVVISDLRDLLYMRAFSD
jgi:hypothetical protein